MRVDDTLAVFHTHAVAGLLGGVLTGLLATPELLEIESLVRAASCDCDAPLASCALFLSADRVF
jgi:ammonia channel protein AmtB